MEDKRKQSQELLRRLARDARRTQTPAEKRLWEMLRDHGCGGLHFRRQEIVGPFCLDFFCRRLKLTVEVDGSIHEEISVDRRDRDRQQILEQDFGIQFLRVTNEDVLQRPQEVFRSISAIAFSEPEQQSE